MDGLFKLLPLSVLSIAVVFLTAVLALVWTMPDLPSSRSPGNLCLEDFGSLHCGEMSNILHNVLEKKIEREYNAQIQKKLRNQEENNKANAVRLAAIYNEHYWEMKPSAKLTADSQGQTHGEENIADDMVSIRNWQNGKDLYDIDGFERYGARNRNGRIVVPVCGTYLVYSHLDVYENSSRTNSTHRLEETHEIRHAIYKFNILDELEVKIIEGAQPRQMSGVYSYNCYSSYVSALVQLKAGDELSVKVTNLPYLNYPADNYFGVNFISDLCQGVAASTSR